MAEQTILIVDDHDVLRKLLETNLHEWFSEVRVLDAADAETAVDLALRERPDAVIMDIALPGMNGIEATRLIKKQLPQTPVIILSVHELDAYKNDATEAGADAYVPKPFSTRELVERVHTLLGGEP